MKGSTLGIFFILMMAGTTLFGQRLEKAKDLLAKNRLQDARTEIDNFLNQEKNQDNNEAWYVKGKVYSAIATDSSLNGTVPDAKETSLEALKKYIEMEETKVRDSTKRFIMLTLDNRAPLAGLYSAFSKEAATYYNAGNFNDALQGFRNSLEIFDMLSSRGWTSGVMLDTISVLYAGISAEKAKMIDTAAMYYAKIADAKARAQGYESIYKWLADYYYQQGDLTSASRYLAYGKELFPEDPFWVSFELNMLSEKGTKDELFAKYDEVIAANPGSHLHHYNYAVELYRAAYDEDTARRPANWHQLVDKAIAMAQRSVEIDPDYPNTRVLLGQIYYNQAVDVINRNKGIRPRGGVKLTPAELKLKEDLRQETNRKFDLAIEQFKMVDEQLSKQGKLKMEEKQFLKDTYDLLINIYEQKDDSDSAALYTDKFNNVDKIH